MTPTPAYRIDLRRGEVYHLTLDKPDRPAVIVSSDVGNSVNRGFVVIVPCLSDAPPSQFESMAVAASELENNAGLKGYFRCDHLHPVSRIKFNTLTARTTLSASDMSKIEVALQVALGP